MFSRAPHPRRLIRRHWPALLGLCVALTGCAAQRPTEILLVIDADQELTEPGRLDEVTLEVGRTPGVPETKTVALPASGRFPLQFALLHEGGPLGPIAITVTARKAGRDVLVREAITKFVPDEIKVLRMDLYSQCVTRVCMGEETCTAQGCVTLTEAGALIPWRGETGTAPRFTGQRSEDVPDGGVQKTGPDAGPLQGSDTMTLVPPLDPIEATEASRDLKTCEIFPGALAFASRVSEEAGIDKAQQSPAYLASMNANTTNLSADFGGSNDPGFPWIAVPEKEAVRPLSVQVGLANPPPAPLPLQTPTRLTSKHLIVVRQGTCDLYEGSGCARDGDGWGCFAAVRWALGSFTGRQPGSVSADPSGLPILPLLVRWKEVRNGLIPHMLRFTARAIQQSHVVPATAHVGGQSKDLNLPPMGLRLRLRADFNESGYSRDARVIITALKTFGMVLSGQGENFALAGETHPGWTKSLRDEIATIPGSAFEAVYHGTPVQ